MAIEQLISAKRLKESPVYTFFIGFFCTVVGMLLAMRVFPQYSSIVMITFAILPLVGVTYKLVNEEEKIYEKHSHVLWKNPVLGVLAFLFLGMVFAFTVGFIAIPQDVTQHLFANQLDTFYQLGGPTAQAVAGICQGNVVKEHSFTFCKSEDLNNDGNYEAVYYNGKDPVNVGTTDGELHNYNLYVFEAIFFNNLQLLLLVFLLSLLFGAGSLFVLAWNASILGVFFGSAIGELVNRTVGTNLYSALPITVWTIWFHGVPEFISFFLAAISGGVLGIVLIKRKYSDKLFKNVIKQSCIVFLSSLILLAIAAAIEVIVLNP